MKKYLLGLLCFSPALMPLQAQEKCAAMHVLEQQMISNPQLRQIHSDNEQLVSDWISRNAVQRKAVITIPVVFHVVYEDATENIHDSILLSQLAVLNEDYRRLNLDATNLRNIFDTIASDVEVEFCLAQRDPYGNPSTGITRTQTTNSSFNPLTMFDHVKASSTGGKDPWPASDYLNIWVCDMSFFGTVFVLGYAQFPGGDPATDGVVLQYQHVGRTFDAAAAPANLGRTATHEVGHWLGLRHIWGDGPCDSTDYVADTPNADDASQSDCDVVKNTCNVEDTFWGAMDPPDMVENFMDYSADACMNTFTRGQKMRMLGFLNTSRASLLTSKGCQAPVAGIDEQPVTNLKVWPNPNDGRFTVSFAGYQNFQITDLSGRIVWNNTASGPAGTFELNLSTGLYFLIATGKEGKSVNRIVVK